MATPAPAAAASPVCAICTDDILPDDIVSKLNCDHQYHRDCLQPWLDSNHDTCPLDRGRITSINGVAVEEPEVEHHVHVVAVENPLREAQALYQRSIRVIRNPSIHSADPVERIAAKTQLAFFSMLFGPP
ncbi:MAG: hypothetical protein KBC64_07845 [Simkaniaceae bacterium]|nr:hypothetical protein [Simkaniaceae bacterium]